jgi:diacylglycerol kinase (ATP)
MWQASYHDTEQCRSAMAENRVCDLGLYAGVIIPPSWIIKLPRKGSFKSSLKNSPKRCASAESARSSNAASARKAYMEHVPSSSLHHHHHHHHSHHARHSVDREQQQQQQPTFILKPIPVANCSPVIVFLNPRSGGNQARNSYTASKHKIKGRDPGTNLKFFSPRPR